MMSFSWAVSGQIRKLTVHRMVNFGLTLTPFAGQFWVITTRRIAAAFYIRHSGGHMSNDRPALAYLGTTNRESFPLLLVLGREYNGQGTVSAKSGQYSFTDSPHSSFWNRAYLFLEQNCLSANSLKKRCGEAKCSPIVFGNAYPKPIPSACSSSYKDKVRRATSQKEIMTHLSSLFSLPLASRVEAVILSLSADKARFENAFCCVRKLCKDINMPLVEVPYFASRTKAADFNAALDDHQRQRLSAILSAFPY
jgi:hypothetical protein